MSKSYPAAYRAGARRAGFQPAPRAANSNVSLPNPANDNWRPSTPLNDNYKRGPTPKQFARAILRAGLNPAALQLGLMVGSEIYSQVRGYYSLNELPASWNSYGWNLTRDCPRNPQYMQYVSGGLPPQPPGSGCLTGQSAASAQPDFYAPNTLNQNAVHFWEYTNCPGQPGAPWATCANRRYALAKAYQKISGGPANLNSPRWQIIRPFIPRHSPLWNPNNLPIRQFVPVPRPVPYVQLKALSLVRAKNAEEQSPTRLRPNPLVEVVVAPQPGSLPLLRPGNVPMATQVYPPVGQIRPEHRYEPPGPRVKERKMIMSMTGILATAVNITTESLDVLDALYWAVPAEFRHGERAPQKRAEVVYRHFLDIDILDALKNLIVNQVTDAAVGTVGRKQADFNRLVWEETGVNVHIGRGPAL